MLNLTDRSELIDDLKSKHDRYEKKLSGLFSWRFLPIWLIIGTLLTYLSVYKNDVNSIIVFCISTNTTLFFLWGYLRLIFSTAKKQIYRDLLLANAEDLKESVEEDFFTKLVKINFKYLDEYYLQTKEQADKSFLLTSFVSLSAFGVIVSGIVMMFFDKTTSAYVATSAGVLAEFISGVFFYLYNRTVIKMREYHQKLVITQNISLALKIAEGLPDENRVKAQENLISRLSENINFYLLNTNNEVSKKHKQ